MSVHPVILLEEIRVRSKTSMFLRNNSPHLKVKAYYAEVLTFSN